MSRSEKGSIHTLFGLLLIALAVGGCNDGSSVPVDQSSDGGPARADAATNDGAGCLTGLSPSGDNLLKCGFGASCDLTALCCMSGTAVVCRPKSEACLGGEKELGCVSSNGSRCLNGTVCCLNATGQALAALKTSTMCPARLDFADFSLTECLSACTNKLPVCQANTECQGGATCHAVVMDAFATFTFGVCY